MADFEASVQKSISEDHIVTGSGPHFVRTYPKKADATIVFGELVALENGELIPYDPLGALEIRGVATTAEEPIQVCTFGSVTRSLLVVDGAAPDAATMEKLEERHIYPV